MAKQRDTEWISTAEAALRIGQTAQAIRDGIKAQKYEGHKVRDHDGKRWVWVVDASTLPSQGIAKQSQTLSLSEEDRDAIASAMSELLAPEVAAKVEPMFSAMVEMAKQLGKCEVLLHELKENAEVTEESTEETKALRAKVEEYERAAQKTSWWRTLLGG